MCGIVAVLARRATREVPDLAAVLAGLDRAADELHRGLDALKSGDPAAVGELGTAAGHLEAVDALLKGVPGLQCLLGVAGGAATDSGAAIDKVAAASGALSASIEAAEAGLDSGDVTLEADRGEELNAVLVRLKDAVWAISRDRVGMARAVADLAAGGDRAVSTATAAHPPASDPAAAARAAATRAPAATAPPAPDRLAALWAIGVALASLDRLEVRGRDSAGVHVLVRGPGLDVDAPDIAARVRERQADALFTSGAVRVAAGCLSFVYKTAAEIGELGDNVARLRDSIRTDPLLATVLDTPGIEVTVLGHTRWASVGVISEPNAHPLNSDQLDAPPPAGQPTAPYVTAALNGDVDNYQALRLSEALSFPAEVTTDAKVIPTLISKRMADGRSPEEAFNETVARFEGSVAIAASLAATPDRLHLALAGSGQSLFVGLAPDAFVVASEAYGLVEETGRFVRMDGQATGGQTVVLDRSGAGTLAGMARFRYGGGELPLGDGDGTGGDVAHAEITTRDIDRAGFRHFLLKEISEAPASFRKTLRGRVVAGPAGWEVRLGPDALPPEVVSRLASASLRRAVVIGQGTAAVAGQAVAAAIGHCLRSSEAGSSERGLLEVAAMPATELSGFGLADDMSDTLVVAVSQSGSTTDTNRTVDLVRERGAAVIGVVNRRNSDLAAKTHGVVYTSDGRDIEMSVASTKAFYAQVAAGWLLALALARAAGTPVADEGRLIAGLRSLPDKMVEVLAGAPGIGVIAEAVAPPRRSWAVVGSGPERVAAEEIRIKLSELCYKAVACDATEDKKHIDLSSEPMVLVFAAGLSGPNADDVAKEVAIYRAHKATPVVVVAAGEGERFAACPDVIEVPRAEPEFAFVLSAMAGHLFGYHAALAIDAQARPLRELREAIEAEVSGAEGDGEAVFRALRPTLSAKKGPLFAALRSGRYDGHLEVATALAIAGGMRFASGMVRLEAYESEMGKAGTPSVVVSDLFDALSAGIDELTRPIDAIKHQAKTVTVGISRSEDTLRRHRLVKETLSAGASPDQIGYRAMRTLAALDAAAEDVLGYTRYAIAWNSGLPGVGGPTIRVIDQGGIAADMVSRTASDPRLRGTKHRAADEREVTVARGRHDGRTVVMVPETAGTVVTGMTLLHVRFADRLDAATARSVLAGYRDRLVALADAITEMEHTFDESRLADVPIVDLLTMPVYVLAERWWWSARVPPGASPR